jgi:hypothetical protein
MYNCKGDKKGEDYINMRFLLDSGYGGSLVNVSFIKKYQKKTLSIGLSRQELSRQIARSPANLPLSFIKERT